MHYPKLKPFLRKGLALLLVGNMAMSAYGQNDPIPNIKVGYTYTGTHHYSLNSFELGYYHCFDALVFSHGPSLSLLGMTREDRFLWGAKLSYEAQLFCLAGKLDLSYISGNVSVTPLAGLSLLGWVSVYAGYNVCFNDSKMSGFALSGIVNINTRKRPKFKMY